MDQIVPVAIAVAVALARRGWRVDRGPSVREACLSLSEPIVGVVMGA